MFVGNPVPDPGSFSKNAKIVLIPIAPGRWVVSHLPDSNARLGTSKSSDQGGTLSR